MTDTYSQGNRKHIFKHFTTSCNNALHSIKAQNKIENNCSCLNVKVFLKELWMLNWHILQYCILQSQFYTVFVYWRKVCHDDESFYMSYNIFLPFNAICMVKNIEWWLCLKYPVHSCFYLIEIRIINLDINLLQFRHVMYEMCKSVMHKLIGSTNHYHRTQWSTIGLQFGRIIFVLGFCWICTFPLSRGDVSSLDPRYGKILS